MSGQIMKLIYQLKLSLANLSSLSNQGAFYILAFDLPQQRVNQYKCVIKFYEHESAHQPTLPDGGVATISY